MFVLRGEEGIGEGGWTFIKKRKGDKERKSMKKKMKRLKIERAIMCSKKGVIVEQLNQHQPSKQEWQSKGKGVCQSKIW